MAHVSRICKRSHAGRDSPALQKPQGGIRGIVGWRFHPLGGRARAAWDPQSSSTRRLANLHCPPDLGVSVFAHIAQAMTDLEREAMLQGLMDGWARRCRPFRATFYGLPPTYWWTDDMGVTGEGGEQGDLLMPAFFVCGQHRALVHVSEDLFQGTTTSTTENQDPSVGGRLSPPCL